MNTVVVPIDFSTPSLNAAAYAVKLLKGSYGTTLILYHMFEKKNDEEIVTEQLTNLKNSLSKDCPLRIETIAIHGNDLVQEIERVVRHRTANLVIMGITGKTGFDKVFVGSNTLKVIDKKAIPVLIVPPDADFKKIKNVALASDFKEVKLATPSAPIKFLLDLFHPALHIVNVDSEHYVSITSEYQKEQGVMNEMFGKYDPDYYFLGMNDFFEAIERFIEDKKIDVLITIPRQYSYLSKFLRERHTKKLAYHTHIPILAAHE